jgi:hypothetical protein
MLTHNKGKDYDYQTRYELYRKPYQVGVFHRPKFLKPCVSISLLHHTLTDPLCICLYMYIIKIVA